LSDEIFREEQATRSTSALFSNLFAGLSEPVFQPLTIFIVASALQALAQLPLPIFQPRALLSTAIFETLAIFAPVSPPFLTCVSSPLPAA
jgi:hypothetical protein